MSNRQYGQVLAVVLVCATDCSKIRFYIALFVPAPPRRTGIAGLNRGWLNDPIFGYKAGAR
jgi:hypothetical protein